MQHHSLMNIGLTGGEINLYEALLELGESTRTELAKRSGISPSKIYDVANRLLEKGIISSVRKNGVLHFSAASPERLNDFLAQKEQKLEQEKRLVDTLIPQLMAQYTQTRSENDVEVFYGWEGMRTTFDDIIKRLGPGEHNYIFGAGSGYSRAQADIFFNQYYQRKRKKGFGTKIIFNEALRKNPARTVLFQEGPNEARFLGQSTFAEINTYKDTVLFILLLKQPIVIRIRSQEAADSCRSWFDTMWKLATP